MQGTWMMTAAAALLLAAGPALGQVDENDNREGFYLGAGLGDFSSSADNLQDFDELDFATTDGVVTLEFADRTRYVLNRQAATNQMWFAAGASAWHYDYDAARNTWLSDRDGHDLYARISEVVSEKLGQAVAL